MILRYFMILKRKRHPILLLENFRYSQYSYKAPSIPFVRHSKIGAVLGKLIGGVHG
ncbi:MAG: hypothetical protein AAF549_01345 [Pseudomonadota bacterium]